MNALKITGMLLAALACCLCIGYLAGVFPKTVPAAKQEMIGTLVITAEDGLTGKPIQNAAIVIPETGMKYYTDDQGKTVPIDINIILDSRFEQVHPKTWGEITILAYKEGYVEYALFNTQVYPGQTRNGPTLLLFPETATQSSTPFSVIEGPLRPWVNELIEVYRP